MSSFRTNFSAARRAVRSVGFEAVTVCQRVPRPARPHRIARRLARERSRRATIRRFVSTSRPAPPLLRAGARLSRRDMKALQPTRACLIDIARQLGSLLGLRRGGVAASVVGLGLAAMGSPAMSQALSCDGNGHATGCVARISPAAGEAGSADVGGATACGGSKPGVVFWGADGHLGRNAYTSIPLLQQIADLKNVFGNAPDTIFYRALSDEQEAHELRRDVAGLRDARIIPIVGVLIDGPALNLADEAAAYDWAYTKVAATVRSIPSNRYWEIGNEWTLAQPIAQQAGGSGLEASDWSRAPSYPLYRGAVAGAVAAIRDKVSNAQIIGGAISGWTLNGLALALANDLKHYRDVDLSWDFTVEHWYNDANVGGNRMGPPDKFYGGLAAYFTNGLNAYSILGLARKPIFFTEFGSGNGGEARLDRKAGENITGLMVNLLSHSKATSSEPGVVGGTIYQLYITGEHKVRRGVSPVLLFGWQDVYFSSRESRERLGWHSWQPKYQSWSLCGLYTFCCPLIFCDAWFWRRSALVP